jgi:glutathione-regulated potassium-efflux system ancillary protein KefG
MNKDLRKVVILLAHPNIKESQANKALVDAVSDMEGVAVFNLYELSQEIAFNVDEWSKIISDASAVIYQFPFYWMSAAVDGLKAAMQIMARQAPYDK